VSGVRLLGDEQGVIDDYLQSPGEDTFRRLFVTLAPRVLAFYRARGCDPQMAQDLAQEVMLKVYEQSSALRQREAFRGWLFRIVRNERLQQLRRLGRTVPTVRLNMDEHENGGEAKDPLAGARFHQWMQALEPDEREIMIFRYVDGLEYHEIAEALQMPTGTVQWKVFHSKKKLAARFGQGRA
jgi:RNA polymerase sigma-70 factor (ECF subfamily)